MASEEKKLINAIQPKKFNGMEFSSLNDGLVVPNHSGISSNIDAMNKLNPKNRWLTPIFNTNVIASTTYVAGRVYLSEIQIDYPVTVEGVKICNYATIAGNLYVGLYGPIITEDTPEGSNLIATSDDTAHAGINQVQYIPFTSSVFLPIGKYYLCLECSDATATIGQGTVNNIYSTELCYYNRGGGYGALTNPCPAVTFLVNTRGLIMFLRAASRL